jgi:diguanylate cyclase (GGDEF)-like protein
MFAASPVATPQRRKLLGVSLVTVFVVLAGIALTALGTSALRDNLAHSRSERLTERASQTTNLFTSVAQGLTTILTTGGAVAEATGGSQDAFQRAIGPRIGTTLLSNVVVFDVRGKRPVETAHVGAVPQLLAGRKVEPRDRLLHQAARTGQLVVVGRGHSGDATVIGIASAAGAGSAYAVYGEIFVPRAMTFGDLKGVNFAVYLGKESPATLLATNARKLPITQHRLVVHLDATGLGQTPVLVYGEPGGVGLDEVAPWLVLVVGIGLALLLALQVELMGRRRDAAMFQAAVNNHQALHDALTGLPNRTLFARRIEELIAEGDGNAAVALLDLDRFKEINDTLGHQSGDQLLQVVGKRLSHCVRPTDLVARLGGDEFGILVQPCARPEDALAVADKVRTAIGGAIKVSGLTIEVDGSIGIAMHPEQGVDVESLLRHADIALYRSKAVHAPVVYSAEDNHYSPSRLQLVSDLRHAIAAGEILVYYQPLAPAGHGPIRSVEALVRWQHPTLGLVPPDEFIPLAEQTGMIRPLTHYVLETSLAQCRTWLDRGYDVGVAVNVGARDLLDANFPDEVMTCLAEAGVEPRLLELEITEDTIFSDPVRAQSVINRLHENGVRFAIDDFGAGQSSLAYLKRLPIDVLKIDRSFVLGMAENDDDAAIVQSAIHLGRNLRVAVVAEGVETAEVRSRLASLGCDLIQGFGLARPLPAAELEPLLGRDTVDVVQAA